VESFNGRLRDELLNETLFTSLTHVREALATWKDDYNTVRPHSALGNLAPAIYAKLSVPAMQPPSLIGSNSEQTLLIPGSPAVILAYVGDKSRALRSRLIVPGDAHGASSVRDVAGAGRTRMSGASASAMLRNAVRSSPRSGPIR
jgi:hypothetical protein